VLTKLEFWLLDVVVELRTPLCFLMEPRLEELFNRSTHGATPDQLTKTLDGLHQRGLIVGREHLASVPLTGTKIEMCLIQHRRGTEPLVTWELTDAGGAAWEETTLPDWSRYSMGMMSLDPNEGVVEGGSREIAEKELLSCSPGERIVEGSRRDEPIAPWQATYWKQLPTGYRIRFKWYRVRPDAGEVQKRWFKDPWYRNPAF
jgi:hypothetical protein